MLTKQIAPGKEQKEERAHVSHHKLANRQASHFSADTGTE